MCSAPCGLVCPRSAVRLPGVCWMGPCSASACFPITGRELRKGRLVRSLLAVCCAMPLSLQQLGPGNTLAYLQAGVMSQTPLIGPLPLRSFARLLSTEVGVSHLEGLISLSLSLSLCLSPFLMYAVKLLSGPSLGFSKVINWAKSKLLSGPSWFSHYKNRGFKRLNLLSYHFVFFLCPVIC